MLYNGIGNMSETSYRDQSNTSEYQYNESMPVRASAAELLDQSNAFGTSSAQVRSTSSDIVWCFMTEKYTQQI